MAWWGSALIGAGAFVVGAAVGCLMCFKIVLWLCEEEDPKG